MNMKTGQLSRISRISRIVLLICILLFAGGIVSLFIVDDDASRSRIAFQTFEVSLMILVIFIPVLVDRIVHVRVTRLMEILFVSFCFSSLILGDVVDFYGRFNWWDDLLHGISGMLLGIVGYSVINIFNKIENNTIKFTPLFVSLRMECFAMHSTLHAENQYPPGVTVCRKPCACRQSIRRVVFWSLPRQRLSQS